jgi:molybdate transport system permease protein
MLGGALTPNEWAVLSLSVKVAACATAGSLLLAVPTALLLARGHFWGRSLLNALVHLPLVLPPVVTGYLLLHLLGTRGVVGGWLADALGIVVAFRWTGAAIAAGVMGFPLVVRALRLGIEQVDAGLEETAATLGASPLRVWLTVTLPLAAPAMLAGAMLGFAKALGEFGATITFVSNIPGETQTLALAIYTATQVPGGDAQVVRLLLLSIAVSFLALLGSEALVRRARPDSR